MPFRNFRKTSVPRHGVVKSNAWNSMQDGLEGDMAYIYDKLLSFEQELEQTKATASLDRLALRAAIEKLEAQDTELALRNAATGTYIGHHCFRTNKDLFFEHTNPATWSIAESKRVRVDAVYGQATLPYDRVVSRFYSPDPDTRKIVPVSDPVVTITAIKETGALRVVNGEIENALNGNNDTFWKREVWYPLHSDVEEVIVDVDIKVPVALSSVSNVLEVHPYPEGLVDVIHVYYETTDTTPNLDITNEPVTSWRGPTLPAYQTSGFRGHFRPLPIQRIKVRLRQRNYVERDGFKVFTYGLQELGLFGVEFDSNDTNVTATNPINDKAIVVKFVAPEGYKFNYVRGIWTDPVTSADLVLAMYSDFALTTKLWDSNSSTPQTSSPVLCPANTTELYVAVGMGYDQSDDVAPILKKLSIKTDVEEI